MRHRDDENILAEISGKPVNAFGNALAPSGWGKTRLQLTPTRLVERTKHIVSETYSELLLQEVQGAALAVRGNPALLALGFATLAIFGLGLIFLLLYLFIMKNRFLIIHGGTFTQHVTVKGDPGPYLEFMEEVLAQAEKIKTERKLLGAGSSAATAGAGQAPAFSNQSSEPLVMNCPSCGAEYRLPPGSAGKKFRCSSCKAVMQAPADA